MVLGVSSIINTRGAVSESLNAPDVAAIQIKGIKFQLADPQQKTRFRIIDDTLVDGVPRVMIRENGTFSDSTSLTLSNKTGESIFIFANTPEERDGLLCENRIPWFPTLGVRVCPEAITPEPVIIDGITIDPDVIYTATITSKATGQVISSGQIKGSDLIRLKDTNVTIKIGVEEEVEREPTLVPQNPFKIVNGEKIFQKEQQNIRVIKVTLRERISASDKAKILG